MISEDFAAELSARRKRVQEQLAGDSLIVFSTPVYRRNGDVEHPYRPSSDIVYLTGFEEPDCAVLLRPQEPHLVMFVRPKDKKREIWDGLRAGVDGAKLDYAADEAHSIVELGEKLPDYLENVDRLHHFWGEHESWDERVFAAIKKVRARRRRGVSAPTELVDAAQVLHAVRQIKTDFELDLMRRCGRLTAEAHNAAMRAVKPGMTEFELQNVVESVFRSSGARNVAYESIVGSGPNATILHYRENTRTAREGELVLIDAGAEFEHYAADITRTFPVSGRFSPEQKQLYELVLEAQRAAIEASVVGNTLDDVHDAALAVIEKGLLEYGLLDSEVAELDASEQKKATARFFMHRTSHFLGMDVHDVGPYRVDGKPVRLAEGMVITVEPGVYVAADDESVAPPYRGIGIRIEDDVLITSRGPEVLTEAAVKSVHEVESLCQEA